MGSEIFNLKSLYLEDTVVRGARVSTKNAPTTRSLEVNPVDEGEEPIVKTGETGINKEYLIQSSLIGNDLNGYGTFIQNSDIVSGYTGAQNLVYGDKIKLDTDRTTYTITGLQGTDVYIVEKSGTKQGWSNPAPDEYFTTGYPQEMEAFYRTAAYGQPLESDSTLAADTLSTLYSAYLSAEQDGKKVSIRTY